MTTDQKLAHIRWYIDQVGKSNNKETQTYFIIMARGAAGAWYADMTISQDDFKGIETELNDLVEEVI